MHDLSLIAVAVGNTRTRIGRFEGKELADPFSVANSSADEVAAAVRKASEGHHGIAVVMSTVNRPFSDAVADRLTGENLLRFGVDLDIRILHALDDDSTVGQDRLLNALGAFARAEQACVVVDAGTAVTVDFVDGVGTFQGGVIAPGLAMMLKSLHEHTSALPLLDIERPDPARGVFGKDTRHAMNLGAIGAVQGLVRLMIERYAVEYGAYPQIVATGGDAALLFENDELVEHVVADLQLVGIREAFKRELDAEGEVDEDEP
ncbi:MAG: type III pantothenate kinase [Phycisphaerales bacterium]